jgi:hypothetical protein
VWTYEDPLPRRRGDQGARRVLPRPGGPDRGIAGHIGLTHVTVRASPLLAGGLFALAAIGCTTRLPTAALAWNDAMPHVAPDTPGASDMGGVGYLRVETDTDLRQIGRDTYYNLRRPYDIYTEDGNPLQMDIDNRDGRTGEEPALRPITPGRYIIASVYGTTYRKVQVEVRSGALTEVLAAVLQEAEPVFRR